MKDVQVVFISSDPYYRGELTIGKVYPAKHYNPTPGPYSTTSYFILVNDLGLEAQYYSKMFATLEKFRQSKINSIIG